VEDDPNEPPPPLLPPHPSAPVPSRTTIAIIAIFRPRDGALFGSIAIPKSSSAAVSISQGGPLPPSLPFSGPGMPPAAAIPANAIPSSRAWTDLPPESVAVIAKVLVAPEATVIAGLNVKTVVVPMLGESTSAGFPLGLGVTMIFEKIFGLVIESDSDEMVCEVLSLLV
jgi:hypothetical protein